MGYRVYPISVGTMTIDKSINTYMQDMGVPVKVEIIMWVIEGEGRLIVVDTGPPSVEHCKRYHREFFQTSLQQPERALRERGVEPETVKTVIMTHLHWDHCGNNSLFPNADFYVQKRELEYAVAPLPVHRKAYEAPTWGLTPKPLWIGNKYIAIEGNYELFPGITLMFSPGHSPGSQAVLVKGESGRTVAIAGDAIPLYDNIASGGDPVPSGVHVNLEDCYSSMERIMNHADVILPGHDPGVFRQPFYA